MGTNENRNENRRTDIGLTLQESAAVWEQLLRLAEGGDIRAIKLYYDMLDKKQRPVTAGGHAPDMEPMGFQLMPDRSMSAVSLKYLPAN